ncbi:3-oxoacyl-[acyl-carrier-protein] synthase-1 [Roseateles sp. YR242]|uniref:beta-ketoacyl synthase N-terminal-like domain-containing protein n=1 Tax=Roseateles sp. YR242 TaxID=1855305 RepID=UPI0008C3A082|nr:beta-ketoacyl synthase N-terminal-like domain-containing protein [Roseateles sp. YR242]SEK88308.1 3-oxoacyl-[acyl-carrier-protein] synthase-1 [Roseateles sp. YR242]
MKPLVMIAHGMCTSLGFNAGASGAAMQAGLSGAAQGMLWDAESGEFIACCRVPLRQWWHGVGKLATLAATAIQDCLVRGGIEEGSTIPILLGCAEPSRRCPLAPLDDALLDQVYEELAFARHPQSRLVPLGQVSGIAAFDLADAILDRGLARHCIVAGVDSFLHQEVVEAFMRHRRVLTPSNSNGFIPGEAAGAVLLSREAPRGPHLRITGWATDRESGTIESDEPLTGRGLQKAIEGALARAGTDIYATQYRTTDLNGEHYKFKEAALALGRVMRRRHSELFDVWHPCEWIGEVGAAIVPCMLGHQLWVSARDAAPGPQCLGHAGTDSGERGAYVARYEGGA